MAILRSLQPTFVLLGLCFHLAPAIHAWTSYANVFVDPKILAAGSFNQSAASGRRTIALWADQLIVQGPWTVTSKQMTPPSGDKHDYMSFSPYAWPDCSRAGNTTQLIPEQVWTTCDYVTRDGQFNPDARMVNDIGNFDDMADAVFYNTMSWVTSGGASYASNAVRYIRTWFLNPETAMRPNLNFAQMRRGPGGQNGTRTGVLDLKCIAKVANSILVLRERSLADWTSDVDSQMVAWSREYISWLQTAPAALEEAVAKNNHGTFYFNQLAALQILVGDMTGARETVQRYFGTLFMDQIAANGDQPLESSRTRPYHYRAYNLAAMITNARLGAVAGFDAWNLKTAAGATIQAALDFAITQDPGSEDADVLFPHVAAVGKQYGDPEGKYAAFLHAKMRDVVAGAPFYLWDNIFIAGLPTGTQTSAPTATSSDKPGDKPDSAALSMHLFSRSWPLLWSVVVAIVAAFLPLL